MIDTDAYENMTWETPSDELEDAVENLLAEVKRLREEISRLNKWEDNVREFFGDDAMIDFYDMYGDEEE